MRRLIYAAVLCAVAALALFAWLLFSQTGLGWTVRLISGASDGAVVVGESSGRLAGDWRLEHVVLDLPGSRVEIAELAGYWQFAELLHGTVSLARLSARQVTVSLTREDGETDSKSGDDEPFELPSLTLPLAVAIGNLEIEDLSIEGADGAELFVLTNLVAELSAGRDLLSLDALRAEAPAFTFEARGRLQTSADWQLDLAGTWLIETVGCSPMRGRIVVSGPLEAPDFSAHLEDPIRAELAGTLDELFSKPSWHLQGHSQQAILSTICVDWPALDVGLSLETTGGLEDYRGTIQAKLALPEMPVVEAALSFTGTESALVVQPSPIGFAGSTGNLSGRLTWVDTVAWQAELALNAFDPGLFQPTLQGNLDAALDVRGEIGEDGLSWQIDLNGLRYRLDNLAAALDNVPRITLTGAARIIGSDTGLRVSSTLSDGGANLEVDGKLTWADTVAWQAELALTAFDPGLFQSTLQGSLDAAIDTRGEIEKDRVSWQVDLNGLRYRLDNLAPAIDRASRITLTGAARITGSDTGLRVSSTLSDGAANLEVDGELTWADGLTWDTRLALDSFDPSLFEALPEGDITGVVQSTGRVAEQQVELQATLKSLSGSLAGYQLQGGGSVDYREGRLHINDLRISNNGNLAEVHGFIDDRLDLHFFVDGAELNRLYQPLQGSLVLSGQLSGTRSDPILAGEVGMSDFSYDGYKVDGAAGSIFFGHDGAETVELDLQLHGLTGDGFQVNEANLRLTGSVQDHLLAIDTGADFGDLAVSVSGQFDEHRRWSGRIDTFSYQHRDYGTWRQIGEAIAAATTEAVRLENFCLESGESSLCVAGSWEQRGPWTVAVPELRLLLADLSRWGVVDTEVSGTVQGELSVTGSGSELSRGTGRLTAPDVSVDLDVGAWYPELRWFDSELSVELLDGVLASKFDTRFVDGGILTATFALAGLTALDVAYQDLVLSGRLQADHLDLSPLGLLTDDYLLPSGHLSLDLDVGGNLGDPSLAGKIELDNGEIGFPELGISLRELEGDLQVLGERLLVELRGRSGNGRVVGNGEMNFSEQDWRGDFTISGDGVELVNQSEMRIIASPDVTLTIGADGGSLHGSVHIPEALLQPDEMKGSVSSSPDVVFVDEAESSSPWPLLFDLQVELGDNVQVKGYGLSVMLTGQLTITESLGTGLTGRGELVIDDGTFTLYGKPLQITRGKILFTGGMIDNPDLDIIAQKTVKGATFGQEGTVVGVKVTGSAQDYHLELFSQPRMADNDIVAYLLLDKPISSGDDDSRGIVNEAVRAIGLSAGSDILGDISGFLPLDEVHLEGSADGGGASLVLGKQLTEDLSISYDFNLFEHAGNFRVRYEFGRGFSVQSRNSVESTGVELLYSFER